MRNLWEMLIYYGKNFYKRFKAAEKEHFPTKQVKSWKMLKRTHGLENTFLKKHKKKYCYGNNI